MRGLGRTTPGSQQQDRAGGVNEGRQVFVPATNIIAKVRLALLRKGAQRLRQNERVPALSA
jgi:hypothetical protein